jgi:GNAT superfamily N-acetyltransferase
VNNKKGIQLEEDMFPKAFTNYVEKDFGILFYNERNKDSYDSNHALIYKNKITDLGSVLNLITEFYTSRNINPNIYQAVEDEGYFKENEALFNKYGYSAWIEGPNNFMVLSAENNIESNKQLDIKLVTEWDERIATDIFIPSNESYEIEVIKNSMDCKEYRFFIGYKEGKAVAATYFHLSEYDCCRFDYIIISKDYRNKGYARELLSYVTDFCRTNDFKNCFQWPAHKTSERICYEAGFRHLFSAEAGRASYNLNAHKL